MDLEQTHWNNNSQFPGVHGPQSGSREPGVGRVDSPLATATLDKGSPNLTGADRARKFGVVGRTGAGPELGWTLPLASRRKRISRRDKRESKIESRSKRKKRVAFQLRPVSGRLTKR